MLRIQNYSHTIIDNMLFIHTKCYLKDIHCYIVVVNVSFQTHTIHQYFVNDACVN